ncbi:MAG: tetratricopeptide repeat protein [Verrucomicrobiae bacterium]|nr:tetratricopeptide repeat protein [Verrucomicrobiae bacterium]
MPHAAAFRVFSFPLLILVLAAASPAQSPALPGAATNAPAPAAPPEQFEQTQFDLANGLFLRNAFDLAIIEYRKYLTWFPNGANTEEVLYRIAECLRNQGNTNDARAQFLAILNTFPKGAFFARTCFRLGEMETDNGHPEESLLHYQQASERAESPETRLAALFYQARTLLQLQRSKEALPVLKELARVEKQNPYRGFALLETARIKEAANELDEARIFYTKAFETDSSALLRAEAGMKAGQLEMNAGHWPPAVNLFEQLSQMDPGGEWVPYSNLQLIRCAYRGDQFALVVRLANDVKRLFPQDAATEVDLLNAHALRALRKYNEAAAAYQQFIQRYPKNPAVENATAERLICLFAVDGKNWEAEAHLFLERWPKSESRPTILCLMGDRSFLRKDYQGAAGVYACVPLDKIPASRAAETVFRHGFSLLQMGQYKQSVEVFNHFLKRFPGHEWSANVLLLRGEAEQQGGRLAAAAGTFSQYVERYPRAADRENVLYRAALLNGGLKRYSAMRAAFHQLLRDYPQTRFASEAVYWTGWSFFEEKKYTDAIPFLTQARQANSKQYGAQTTSRLIICHYQLGQRVKLLKEVDALPPDSTPQAPEIYEYLARQSAQDGDPVAAERNYRRLLAHPGAGTFRQSARWGLAKSLAAQNKWKNAIDAWESYQTDYPDLGASIPAKLELIPAYAAAGNLAKAQETAEDVMRLQPEGVNNAQARFRLGEAFAEQKKFADAGKYYISVGLLYNDPDLAPRSLAKAIRCFENTGDTNQVARLRQELKAKYPDFRP